MSDLTLKVRALTAEKVGNRAHITRCRTSCISRCKTAAPRAHDVALPGSNDARLGFLMYPQAETNEGRIDSLDPDNFQAFPSAFIR